MLEKGALIRGIAVRFLNPRFSFSRPASAEEAEAFVMGAEYGVGGSFQPAV
jgi:hypothetical protein